MKNTGVIRRIDDLGRIVIPKEIRKNLKIKDGESLEILLENDNIVLKKYSYLNGFSSLFNNYVDSINFITGENVLITDLNSIVAFSGNLKNKYLDKPISSTIDAIIQDRVIVVSTEFNYLYLTDDLKEYISYAIAPIIINGDAIGAIMIFSKNNNIGVFEEKIINMAAKFLSKYIE